MISNLDWDASKQRARYVPSASADICWGGRLRDESKEFQSVKEVILVVHSFIFVKTWRWRGLIVRALDL